MSHGMKALILLVVICICCWHGNAYNTDGGHRLSEQSLSHEDDDPEYSEREDSLPQPTYEEMDREAEESMDPQDQTDDLTNQDAINQETEDQMDQDLEDPMDQGPVAAKSCEQDGCKHGGTCDSRTGQCSCTMGFSGLTCEEYDTHKLMEKKFNDTNGLRKCTLMDKETKPCSDEGFLCPFVDCPPCRPCEEKVEKEFQSGDLRGCIMEALCQNTGPIKFVGVCDPSCQKIQIKKLSEGLYAGCEKEECINAIGCPTRPNITACQELISKPHWCAGCVDYEVKDHSIIEEQKCEEHLCKTWEPEGNTCKVGCVPYVINATECENDICFKKGEMQKDSATCTAVEKCQPQTVEEVERALHKCLVVPGKYNELLTSVPCKKCYGSVKIEILTCPSFLALELRCIPKQPEICQKFENSRECHSFEESFGCSLALAERCPQECTNYTECHCRPSPKSCPPGLKLVKVDCDMSDKQIRSNPICAEERCPKSYGGIRKLNQCQPESCEVCPDMDGAEITLNEQWLNKEFCNSDMECCHGCRHAKDVARCPTGWDDEKKKRCGCKS